MKVEIVREQPAPPPVKEVVLRLTEREARVLKAIGTLTSSVSAAVAQKFMGFSAEVQADTLPLLVQLQKIGVSE